MVKNFRIDGAVRALAARKIEQTLTGGAADVPEEFVGPGNRVGREQYVVQFTKTVRRDDWFILETIYGCSGDASAGECIIK